MQNSKNCPNNAKTATAGNQPDSRILFKLWLTVIYLAKKDMPAFDDTLGLWFSEKMNLPLAFLVAAVVLFTANCDESENDCEISDSQAIEAATEAMKNCNSNIKHCFDVHEGKGVAKLYCRGMMVRFLCPLSAAFLSLHVFFFFSLFLSRGVFHPSFTNALSPLH